jgi:hypothetical protein
MITIADGVQFDTIAREWRCKWSADNDKASLVAAQAALTEILDPLKSTGKVQRVVCGGCLDFKVITSLPAADFKKWEEEQFAPEQAFLETLKGIDGITVVETQTYTLMEM